MPASHRLATLAVAISTLAPVAAYAIDDFNAASSNAPMEMNLCGSGERAPIKTDACKQYGYDQLITAVDKAAAAALAKVPANVRMLLKRDQAWFHEMMVDAADNVAQSEAEEQRDMYSELLRQRAARLDAIAEGFGRPGLSGKWVNAFGTVTVMPAEGGAFRVTVETAANYDADSELRPECKVSALVKPANGGWVSGLLLPDEDKPAAKDGDATTTPDGKPTVPTTLKLRRQGDTLRVVLADADWWNGDRPNCEYPRQVTGSYFGSGKLDVPADKADVSFTAPTFDCNVRLETATEEEICADPELAENDHRLNRAWKALLPRLDEATRRALTEDQRKWVGSQTLQYPEFLHPGWEKRTTSVHYTTEGRDKVNRLQRERIALLEGFDDKRSGLAGTWLAYNAVIHVTVDKDGGITAKGWKWDQGDWKAGCDYEMSGKIVGGTFRSGESRKNPDTLERDHATLVVNRLDDEFAKKRFRPDGTAIGDPDEAKCRRSRSTSSTARLFPARPSEDIDNTGNGSIR